jgi:hypothetical protein
MLNLLTTMMIDDYATSEEPRAKTRVRIMDAIAGRLPAVEEAVAPVDIDKMKEKWGRTPEAMAMQEELPEWLV